MIVSILTVPKSNQKRKRMKVVCITCHLRGCVGLCRFETVESLTPPPPKAA
jgi:hypothetical protein